MPLCLALTAGPASASGVGIDPAVACGLLDDHGLRVRDGYRDLGRGVFECASIPQRLPRGTTGLDEVRFVATGRRARVGRLQLELSLRSRGDPRPALQAFAALADAMSARGLGQPLPSEARRAITTGIPGAWRVGDAEVALEKIGGAVPALRLFIR